MRAFFKFSNYPVFSLRATGPPLRIGVQCDRGSPLRNQDVLETHSHTVTKYAMMQCLSSLKNIRSSSNLTILSHFFFQMSDFFFPPLNDKLRVIVIVPRLSRPKALSTCFVTRV